MAVYEFGWIQIIHMILIWFLIWNLFRFLILTHELHWIQIRKDYTNKNHFVSYKNLPKYQRIKCDVKLYHFLQKAHTWNFQITISYTTYNTFQKTHKIDFILFFLRLILTPVYIFKKIHVCKTFKKMYNSYKEQFFKNQCSCHWKNKNFLLCWEVIWYANFSWYAKFTPGREY